MKKDQLANSKQYENSPLKDKLIELSFYTACASTIAIAESLIPKPFPFLKIGLANVVIILLLMKHKDLSAFLVIIAKVILSGFFLGSLLMPTTIIGLASGLTSLVLMLVVRKYSLGLSWVGISILGAIAHNITQIIVVRLMIIYSNSIFDLIPILLVLGLGTGTITGLIASVLKQRLTWSFNEKKT